jgi:phage-related protein
MKAIIWKGSTLNDLKDLGEDVCRKMGTELMFVQMGSEPSNWKPMNDIGAGVKEIRVKIAGNAYRTIYIATLADAIYVLHCFQKKTQKTPKQDMALAKRRLSEILRKHD